MTLHQNILQFSTIRSFVCRHISTNYAISAKNGTNKTDQNMFERF